MLEELTSRRSIRSFKKEQIKDEELEKILIAGEYAPSGHGKQSPYFLVLQNENLIARLSKNNSEILGKDTDPFYKSPTVIVIFGDINVSTYYADGVLAAGNMLNEAHSLGIGSCYIYRAKEQFETEDGKSLKKELGIPENYVGVANVILGYPNQKPLPAPRKKDYYKVLK